MKKIISFTLLTVFCVLISNSLLAQKTKDAGTTESINIVGTYDAQGTNPDGSVYTGTCEISHLEGATYFFKWKVGTYYEGKGDLVGTKISVDFGDTHPVIYTVSDGGNLLQGTWANGTATETLKK